MFILPINYLTINLCNQNIFKYNYFYLFELDGTSNQFLLLNK